MKEWGSELWDRFEHVVSHNRKETQELEGVYGKFLKERGDIEKEYAKSLRKLVNNYSPKENKKEHEEETSLTKAFRLVLQETKYQANQHESLADLLVKSLTTKIQKKVKEFSEVTRKSIKEAKRISEEKEKSDRGIEKSKIKYQRSFFDWEQAEMDYTKADSSNEVSRNQIDKLKKTSTARQRMCEQYRGDYARELIRANEHQRAFYYTNLPTVLNNLQNLEVSRTNFLKEVLLEGVQAEKEISPIIVKCLEEIERCIESIDATADTQLVIDRHKTGNVPPCDSEFEEMKLGGGGDKYKTLKKQSKAIPPSEHLYPQKRELERRIEALEQDIQKGQKEIAALRRMYETYSQNPQFGDKNNFQGELESATLKVQNQEAQMHTLKTELGLVEHKLDQIQNRTPNDTPKSGRRSPSHSDKGSVGSTGYGTSSNASEQDTDSLGDKGRVPEAGTSWEEATSWPEEDFTDEFEDLPPPPANLGLARALYDFMGVEESNISMCAGEEFHLLEGDTGGWTKVQRMDMSDQGFVPSAFLEELR